MALCKGESCDKFNIIYVISPAQLNNSILVNITEN